MKPLNFGEDYQIISAFKSKLKKLRLELKVKETQHDNLARATQPNPKMFEHMRRFLADPLRIWKNGDALVKRALLRTCFAAPLAMRQDEVFEHPN